MLRLRHNLFNIRGVLARQFKRVDQCGKLHQSLDGKIGPAFGKNGKNIGRESVCPPRRQIAQCLLVVKKTNLVGTPSAAVLNQPESALIKGVKTVGYCEVF